MATSTLTAQDVRATADSADSNGRDDIGALLRELAEEIDNPRLTRCLCGCVRFVETTTGSRCALCGSPR